MVLRRLLGNPERSGQSRDAGLQAERTAMAWQRTALGVGGVSALLLHETGGRLLAALPGLVGLLVSLVLLVLTEVRYEQTLRRVDAGETPSDAIPILVLACSVVGLAVAAIALIALSEVLG
jgi:putative membrane protein